MLKAYWKIEPTIETEGLKQEEIDEAIHDKLMNITLNPHDYIGFE